jgi:cytidine deaminase
MTDDTVRDLLPLAIRAADNAYVPYSNYRVGAALRAADGTVYTGCNVENSAYPASICAERTALVKAVSEGQRAFDTVVIVTANGGSPCGHCRQMLYEFTPDMRVVMADFDGRIVADTTLAELLPLGFGPDGMK